MIRKFTLLGAMAFVALTAACSSEDPSSPTPSPNRTAADRDSDAGFTYAVIGDMPYKKAKIDSLPKLIALINQDQAVEEVIHVGDIKAGSGSPCTDTYADSIKAFFDTFEDPLVYTPGDNEWTDCHKYLKNNGLYTPTERLQKIRSLFFPQPGRTLGIRTRQVSTQASDPANAAYVENVSWKQNDVVFATVNITGSDNDLAPWFANPATDMPADYLNYPTQAEESAARAQANAAWIARAFALATTEHAKGLVLAFQADMWDPAEPILGGYDALVQQIGSLAAEFGRPVLLLEGDSHVWRTDRPFTPGAEVAPGVLFSSLHPGTPVAPNVTRLVVDGSSSPTSYTRLTINPGSAELFTLTRVPLVPVP